MTSPAALTSEEKIIVALACLIGIIFLLFAPHSCKPGATALSLPPEKKLQKKKSPSNSIKEAPNHASHLNNRNEAPFTTSAQASSRNSPQQIVSTKPFSQYSSPNKNEETKNRETTNKVLTNSKSPPTASPIPNASKPNQLALQEAQAQKRNDKLLRQLEELAAESNTLKKERREREDKFVETKNEYAATLKFAQAQYQEKLLTLEKKNIQLSQKLAENAENISPETSSDKGTPPDNTTGTHKKPNFAQNDKDLDKSKKALVTAIRDMDSLSGNALTDRYQSLENQLNSKSAGRIRFLSGSSQATASEIIRIVAIAEASKPKSEFLVAGFADHSGSANSNRNLSSKRAKFVAEQLGKKVGNERIQAIYLGQTDRFGSAAENRVVEIWEITPETSQ